FCFSMFPPPPPSTLFPYTTLFRSPGLSRIVKRCLAKEPARRYQSALDLRSDLEDLKQDVDSGALTARAAAADRDQRPSRTWRARSEEHTSELQSLAYLVCRLLLEK